MTPHPETKMKRLFLLAGLMLSATTVHAQDKVTIEFVYPYSAIFDVTYEAILPRFQEAHPNIEVKFRASYEEYERLAACCCWSAWSISRSSISR